MKSLEKNFIYNIVYQILTIFLPLITAPYIARTLGAESVGIYSYTYSVAQYFLLFAMLGISNHGNRSIAAARDNKEKVEKTFWSIYSIQVFTYCIAIILYGVYLLCFNIDNTFIAGLQFVYVLSGAFDISWYFFGTEQFKVTVTRNVIIKLITVVAMFIFVHTPSDLWKYTIIMVTGTLISQLYLWKYLKKQIAFCKVKFRDIQCHIKQVLILFIPVIAYSIYKLMDKIMLGNMTTYAQVGYYENASKIINIPMGIITALGTVMLPHMSNMVARGEHEKSKDYIRISVKLVTIMGSAIAFGLIGTSDILVPIYFGRDFMPSAPLIELLSVTVFFISWANVIRTQYLIPYHKDKVYLHSTIIGALVNLVINMALIPTMQGNGAAIGTIVAEFTVVIVQIFEVRKEINVTKYIISSIPYIIIGLVMNVVVKLLGAILGVHITTLIIQICVGGVVYCGLCALYLFISKDEMGKLVAVEFGKKLKGKNKLNL